MSPQFTLKTLYRYYLHNTRRNKEGRTTYLTPTLPTPNSSVKPGDLLSVYDSYRLFIVFLSNSETVETSWYGRFLTLRSKEFTLSLFLDRRKKRPSPLLPSDRVRRFGLGLNIRE